MYICTKPAADMPRFTASSHCSKIALICCKERWSFTFCDVAIHASKLTCTVGSRISGRGLVVSPQGCQWNGRVGRVGREAENTPRHTVRVANRIFCLCSSPNAPRHSRNQHTFSEHASASKENSNNTTNARERLLRDDIGVLPFLFWFRFLGIPGGGCRRDPVAPPSPASGRAREVGSA